MMHPDEPSTLAPGLYSVAVPIGNPEDITLRAIDILRDVDAVICEERKAGIRLLKPLGIEKPLYFLNEHTIAKEITALFEQLLIMKDKAIALITDAGTPGFADPGAELIELCHQYNVPVFPVPGASSLMAALMVSGLGKQPFLCFGFLPANRDERQKTLRQIKAHTGYNLIFLEAPYRLKSILPDFISIFGKNRNIRFFYKLTQPQESIFLGSLEELQHNLKHYPKGEFILILEHLK